MKRLLNALGLALGLSVSVWAAPTSGPAGNFIINVSTNASTRQQAFTVSSGTIVNQLSLPYLTPGQCTTTNAAGQVVGIACGSGAASVAFTSGTAAGFAGIVSSPTAVGVFNNAQFIVTQQGGATAYFALNPASVTLQGNNLSAAYLTNSSATATYLQQSSATATYLQQSSATATYIQVSTIVAVSHGGTGTSSPGLIAGTNITSITGSWPNQTINAASSGGGGGGANGTIVASPQFDVPYYSLSGTTTTLTGMSGVTTVSGNDIELSTITASSGTVNSAFYTPYNTASRLSLYGTGGFLTNSSNLLYTNGDLDITTNGSSTIIVLRQGSQNADYIQWKNGVPQTALMGYATPAGGNARFELYYGGFGVWFQSVGGGMEVGNNFQSLPAPANGFSSQGSIAVGTNTTLTSELQVFTSTSNIYGLYVSTAMVGGNSVAISSLSEILVNGSAGTNGQALTSGGPGTVPSWTTITGGGGPSLSSTQTWTGQNNWKTPAQSTFTYGLTVGSFTVNGSSAGQVNLTEGSKNSVSGAASGSDIVWADSTDHWLDMNPNGSVSTYTVVGSSSAVTVGDCVEFGSKGSVVDAGSACGTGSGGGGGSTGGSIIASTQGNVGYYSAVATNTINGSSKFQFNGTSVTVVSSMVVTNTGTGVATPSLFNVFANGLSATTDIFAVGSSATSPLFEVPYNSLVKMNESGASIGNLQIGGRSDGDNLGNAFSLTEAAATSNGQGITIYDGSKNVDIYTANVSQGGNNGSINFIIGTGSPYGVGGTTEMSISSQTINISTNVTLSGSAGANGQVFTSGGSGALPTWNTPSGIVSPGTFTWVNNFGIKASTLALINSAAGTTTLIVSTAASGVSQLAVSPTIAVNSTDPILSISSAAGTTILWIDNAGNLISSGTTPSVSSCGSTPSIIGNNISGQITVGGGVVTACTLTFANGGFVNAPICVPSDNSATVAVSNGASSASSQVFNLSATLGGGLINYICIGFQK